MPVSATQLRQLMGNFATGCTVVTMAADPPHGLTANAFTSVSIDPPLILVCVDHETESYEILSEGDVERFCINILAREQRDLAEHFAGMDEIDDDPFKAHVSSDIDAGAPVFEENLAYLDCTTYESHEAGDHTIYLGEVVNGDALRADAEPLTFYQGGWGTIDLDE